MKQTIRGLCCSVVMEHHRCINLGTYLYVPKASLIVAIENTHFRMLLEVLSLELLPINATSAIWLTLRNPHLKMSGPPRSLTRVNAFFFDSRSEYISVLLLKDCHARSFRNLCATMMTFMGNEPGGNTSTKASHHRRCIGNR